MAEKPRTPFVDITRTEGWLVMGVAIFAAIIAGIFVGKDEGTIAGGSAGAIALLIIFSWPVRREVWFWTAVAALSALHIYAVVHFDWSFTHSWTGREVSGFFFSDDLAMMALIYGLYRLKYGTPAQAVAELPDEARYGERDLNL